MDLTHTLRATLPVVEVSYTLTRTRPTAETWAHHYPPSQAQCCPLTAVMLYAQLVKLSDDHCEIENTARLVFGNSYVEGFLQATDAPSQPADRPTDRDYMRGWRDGREVQQALLP